MTEKTTRRTLLSGTAAAALTGLAGCSSIRGSGSATTSEPKTTTGSKTTGSATTSESKSAMGDSSVHASDAQTGYGIDLSGNPVMGPDDAPVDVYYWTDYQCPFCGRFEENTFPKLVESHVTEGKVRFVMLQLPNIGEASTTAARLDKCVWRQVRDSNPGAYSDWHAAVFDAQEEPDSGWAKTGNLLGIARDVDGVDADAAMSCLENDTEWAKDVVSDDVSAGTDSGISATPGFVLYNRESDKAGKLVGAQPYDRFASAIEKIENA
ncbi:DsbA family protein [Halorussus salinisoli]|uniref:DsbA family protein n=1 Tax=Halorussus salinisoli TaxID=2558242 RepID=UPI0010C236A4|nr:DsbA family protein [Halorussus salinisoli]